MFFFDEINQYEISHISACARSTQKDNLYTLVAGLTLYRLQNIYS